VNLNNVEKKFMEITFRDTETEKGKTISVLTPTKQMFDKLTNQSGDDVANINNLEKSYTQAAELMSRNKENETITAEWLEEQLDVEEITMFFDEFINFITQIKQSPN